VIVFVEHSVHRYRMDILLTVFNVNCIKYIAMIKQLISWLCLIHYKLTNNNVFEFCCRQSFVEEGSLLTYTAVVIFTHLM